MDSIAQFNKKIKKSKVVTPLSDFSRACFTEIMDLDLDNAEEKLKAQNLLDELKLRIKKTSDLLSLGSNEHKKSPEDTDFSPSSRFFNFA